MIFWLKNSNEVNSQTFLPQRYENTKVHKVGSWLAWLLAMNREKHVNHEQNSRFQRPEPEARNLKAGCVNPGLNLIGSPGFKKPKHIQINAINTSRFQRPPKAASRTQFKRTQPRLIIEKFFALNFEH
ncbi:hypothetical protein L0128_05955 [candidate division KSB1 bacterium]|nr:hypothetical protein [candidate division KSB1 bacterium]